LDRLFDPSALFVTDFRPFAGADGWRRYVNFSLAAQLAASRLPAATS
jgi:hypothetical protein